MTNSVHINDVLSTASYVEVSTKKTLKINKINLTLSGFVNKFLGFAGIACHSTVNQ